MNNKTQAPTHICARGNTPTHTGELLCIKEERNGRKELVRALLVCPVRLVPVARFDFK